MLYKWSSFDPNTDCWFPELTAMFKQDDHAMTTWFTIPIGCKFWIHTLCSNKRQYRKYTVVSEKKGTFTCELLLERYIY